MHELTTTATIVDPAALGEDVLTATLPRRELEDAFSADAPARLWLELAQEGYDEPTRLTIDLAPDDLEAILGLVSDEEIALAFDDDALASMFGDAEVEAHGMRGALAIAVVAAAVAAPAGLAATPQTASPATDAQRVSAAATVQVSSLAVSPQIASLATKTQISPQVSKAAKKAQISAAKRGGLQVIRAGILR